MIRLVFFDIDGTLVHTGRAGVRAFNRVAELQFGKPGGFERFQFAGRTDSGLVREFFSLHRIDPTPENFERFFLGHVHWLDHILASSAAEECPGVRAFIRELQDLPNPPLLGLLTGNIRLGAEIKLRHFGLWDFFTVGAFAEDSENRDEIAAVARSRGCRFLGEDIRNDQVLVIGDTPLDVRCARAIGAKVLAVATGGATFDELRRHHPDWTVENLTKIRAGEVTG